MKRKHTVAKKANREKKAERAKKPASKRKADRANNDLVIPRALAEWLQATYV